jgi:hypothetical protein
LFYLGADAVVRAGAISTRLHALLSSAVEATQCASAGEAQLRQQHQLTRIGSRVRAAELADLVSGVTHLAIQRAVINTDAANQVGAFGAALSVGPAVIGEQTIASGT